jgi:hypothetical protein
MSDACSTRNTGAAGGVRPHHHPIFQLFCSSFKDDVTAILLLDVPLCSELMKFWEAKIPKFSYSLTSDNFFFADIHKNVFVSTLV